MQSISYNIITTVLQKKKHKNENLHNIQKKTFYYLINSNKTQILIIIIIFYQLFIKHTTYNNHNIITVSKTGSSYGREERSEENKFLRHLECARWPPNCDVTHPSANVSYRAEEDTGDGGWVWKWNSAERRIPFTYVLRARKIY